MRVPRTFAFVDLSGFTNYTAAYGDDAAGRILSAFRSLVREISSERGVRIAKWLGDGCMMVSVDQTNAIAFALDLEQRSAEVCAPLALRVGIATGYALLFEGDDYIGRPVNMAARLCEAAGPGELLAAGLDRELPDWVEHRGGVTVRATGIGDISDVAQLSVSPDAWAHSDGSHPSEG